MAFNPKDPEFLRSARPASAYSNRAFVTIHEGVARLSFGEAPANAAETTYHTAISMTATDALHLADAIYAVYDEVYAPPPPPPAGARGGSTILSGLADNLPPKPGGSSG